MTLIPCCGYTADVGGGPCRPVVRKVKEVVEEKAMGDIARGDVNEEWAHAGYVEAGDFVFLSYCVGNVGKSVEEQVHGALDHMEMRLAKVGLTLSDVVKLDILLRDVWNIPIMEKVFKERFRGVYPARKTIGTDFAHVGGPEGLHVQIDGIAYRGKKD
jgi:2-iminobutanoate/2-iminopropanoate deaminase